MTAAAMPARDRLPALESARAEAQTAWVETFHRRRLGDLLLTAATADADAHGWIATGDGRIHLAPRLADGAALALLDAAGHPDAASAAAALGHAEPLVAAVEAAAGIALRPEAVVAAAPADAIVLAIKARAGDRLVHRLLVAVTGDTPPLHRDTLPRDPATVVGIAPRWTARIAGPRIDRAAIARVATGDLLLLGTPLPLARFSPPGHDRALAARLDMQGGLLTVEQVFDQGDRLADAPPADIQPDLSALSVDTHVEIDGGGLSLDRLAALAPGSVVALPHGGGGGALPVRLVAGGRAVATGELVAIGDGYGVLVTATLPGRG